MVAYPAQWPAPVAPYPIEQFLDLPWILNVPGTGDAAMTDAVFARMGMRPKVAAYCDDLTATLTMVASGLGAAPVPRLGVSAEVPDGVLMLQTPWLNLSRSVFALIPTGRESAAVTGLLEPLELAMRSAPLRH